MRRQEPTSSCIHRARGRAALNPISADSVASKAGISASLWWNEGFESSLCVWEAKAEIRYSMLHTATPKSTTCRGR